MSNTTSHTPGPWHTDGWENMVINDQWGTTIVIAPGSSTGTLGEMKANARLIAAAPDLLEAVKNLLAGPNWPGARMTAEHAIAKAEGN